jgi:sortase A
MTGPSALIQIDDEAPPLEVKPEPAPAPATRGVNLDAGSIVRRGLVTLGCTVLAFCVFAFWFSGLAHARAQVGLQRRFRVELNTAQAPIGGNIAPGAPVALLKISRTHTDEVVVEGSRSGLLRAGPGHVVGSSLPGQPGNAVIAGRRTFYGGPFRRLGSLRPGDAIEVTTGQGVAHYRVTGVAKMSSDDGSELLDHGDNRLTLFTADPALQASRRLVATATLVGAPFPATPLRRTLDAQGLGLGGEHDAIALVLVWLELLLVVVLLAVFALTRWSRITTWVVFAPAVGLLLWMVFENSVRLLPATL